MGAFDIFGTGDQKQAANDQIWGITQGANAATGNINTGNSALTTNFGSGAQALNTNYTAGLQPFLTNWNTAQKGVDAYGDATGANGAAGNARATAAFENNPGIKVQEKMGDDAINAYEAATGKSASGNALVDLDKYNSDLGKTSWNNYVQSLSPYFNYSTSGAQGIGQMYSGLGNQLNYNNMGLGTALNANQNKLADLNYGAFTSIGNANANKDLAGLNASANILGAGSGLLSSLMSFLPA